MDKHATRNGNLPARTPDQYPYIDFDEDGNPYIVTERDTIPYAYATNDSEREKYPDAASCDHDPNPTDHAK